MTHQTKPAASPGTRRALVHNAITKALSDAGDWVPLSVRIAATRAVLAEVDAWHAAEPDAACAHCGSSDHTWDGCEAYTRLVAEDATAAPAAVSAAVAPPTNRAVLRDRIEVWPLARVLAEVQCGSADWSWEEEWADLDQRHAETGYLATLEQQIQERGITMPVLIGSDGRLWDGHHRLRIAVRLGIPYVPVELTPPADAVLAVLPEPTDKPAASRDRVAEAALAAVETALCDTLVPDAREEALAGIVKVLPPAADRAAILREAISAVRDGDLGPRGGTSRDYEDGWWNSRAAAEQRIRSLVDTSTQPVMVVGHLRPMSEQLAEEMNEGASRIQQWAARAAAEPAARTCPPDCPCHAVCIGPIAGARQDGADHACNSVQARGEMDEPLGYQICGVCGKRQDGAET